MCTEPRNQPSVQEGRQYGATLIELVIFIVIISLAVTGILLVMNLVTAHSADAVAHKQALAIAESLLEEIELQGVSGVNTVTGSADANRTSFDNVFNYAGYSTTGGIRDFATNTVVPSLTAYNVTPAVTVASIANLNGASAVQIDVHVTGPGGTRVDLTGYRAGN